MPSPILVVPTLAIDTLVRAMGSCASALGVRSLDAWILPIEESQVTVVRLGDGVDAAAMGRALSAGGTSVGVASVALERWETWRDGSLVVSFGPDDALVVPLDASGDPDLDAEPQPRAAFGDQPTWRVRSALDRGMQGIASCRFGPVAHALASPKEERHFSLVNHGHRVESELPG